ncbi:DNA-directed RNA polymerase III subunit RPC5 [Cryptococcus neoformans Gb118]|nr:DNA-directed RNA polymerase III subunit RPC5 [Cryptococcus neoformans var. grubii MW-RSA36]OXL11111.1 DNA-directed RNA polymerase III subunit RPC5 [Cryptococcus neoformans var. grubii Gb118]
MDSPHDNIETVVDTITSYPEARESDGPHLSASDAHPTVHDLPGPSTTYIPRQPSPPLPDLKTRSFPVVDASDDEDDEDDEPIATLPIYLSPGLGEQGLDLHQYPLQHRDISVPTWARDRGKTISARVKEKAGRVEVEIPVDAGAAYWREDRASELGFVVDVNGDDGPVGGYGFGGKEKDKKGREKVPKKKEEKWGDKMRLRSELVPNATGYYSGVVRDGALHLHPISRVLQFRTSLGYLDDVDQKSRSRRLANGAVNGAGDSDEEEAPKKKKAAPAPVAKPRRVLDEEDNDGTGSIKDFRNKMWAMAIKEDEDSWAGYSWKAGEVSSSEKKDLVDQMQDDAVGDALGSLILDEEKRERLTCQTRPLDYLDRAM